MTLTASQDLSGPVKIYYTTNGDEPTTSSSVYNGPIQVSSTKTIKAIAVDRAGNQSQVPMSETYTIDKVAPNLSADKAAGSYDAAIDVGLSSGDPDAKIYYTTDGSDPADPANANRSTYSAPFEVGATQTVRVVAIDPAGNSSQALERKYTIRTASSTTLRISTANLKLGKVRTISGAVGPVHGGRVQMTIKRNGAQVLSRNLLLSNSSYGTTYKPRLTGSYSVTVAFAKDADHLGSTVTRSFRVIR